MYVQAWKQTFSACRCVFLNCSFRILDDIEANVERAYSNVGSGNEQLLKAAEYQVDTLSCVCVGNLNECTCFIFLPERWHECVVITLSFSVVH